MTQDKAQSAVNGCSLDKGCNAVLSHLWASLRAHRKAASCGVTLLGKDAPLFTPSLALPATRLARKCFPEASFHAERALQLTAARRAENVKQYRTLHLDTASLSESPCLEAFNAG